MPVELNAEQLRVLQDSIPQFKEVLREIEKAEKHGIDMSAERAFYEQKLTQAQLLLRGYGSKLRAVPRT